MARWLQDGNIRFLGRKDHQVKIRGFRIELGEIESHLRCHENLKDAVVLTGAREKKDDSLCAYIVPLQPGTAASGKTTPTAAELKEYLSRSLPDYMIPTYFLEIDRIPVTSSGKIHRKALPAPVLKPGQEYTAPGDEIEKKITAIWSELLGIKKDTISIEANFFHLGGHSLKAATLVSKIQKEFNITLPLIELFKSPSIKSLAEFARIGNPDAGTGILTAKDDNLILLRPGTDRSDKSQRNRSANHLFLIHCGTGEVDKYGKFCERLTNDMTYWGIRADRLDNGAPRNLTIREMARHYIEKMKKVQPRGPYYIAAWCFGGLIAFEMVKQLEQEKENIRFLGLINSPPPQESPINTDEFNLQSELKIIDDFSLGTGIKEKVKNVNELSQFWLLVRDYLETTDYDTETLKNELMKVGWHQALSDYQQLDTAESVYYLNLYRSFLNAMVSYTPGGKIHTPVYYFAANKSKHIIKERWNDYCYKPVKFYEVSGDNFSIFEMPGLEPFAKLFDKIMQSTMCGKQHTK